MNFAIETYLHNEPVSVYRHTEEIEPISVLSWLRSQVRFPKFYWQSKDQTEEVACCGQLLKFYHYPQFGKVEDPTVKFYGHQTFDNSRILFFLPTLEVTRKNNHYNYSQNLLSLKTPLIDFVYDPANIELDIPQAEINSYTPNYSDWCDLHQKAIDAINDTELVKLVLARKAQLKLKKDVSALDILTALKDSSSNSYIYFIEKKAGLSFFGASPERLFSRFKRNISSDILAGTTSRGKSLEEDTYLQKELRKDVKETAEFDCVEKYIERALSSYCMKYSLSDLQIYQTQSVQHLYKEFKGILKPEITDEQLIEQLHPTPAMGGLPRDAAITFLKKHDIERKLYSAPFGWISPERAEILAAIRCVSMEGRRFDLFSGTGIVLGSKAESEWNEHNHKIELFTKRIFSGKYQPTLV